LLRASGWRVLFEGFPESRGVVIVYPHTSNWDFVLGLLAKWSIGQPIRWVGKETLFRGATGAVVGRILRRWGGSPVDRHRPSRAVEQMAATIESHDCWLGLSPEGTRKWRDHIRSGFYHLACRLDVPVGLGFIDYRRKVIGLTHFVRMTGSVESDLDRLREYYRDISGRYPAQAAMIRFRDTAR